MTAGRTTDVSDAERLARAVLLFYKSGPWTDIDRELWSALTGTADATTKSLGDLARRTLNEVERQ